MSYKKILEELLEAEKNKQVTVLPIPSGTVVCELFNPTRITVLVAGRPLCGLEGEETRQEFIWLGLFSVDDGHDISLDITDEGADDPWPVPRSNTDIVLTTTSAQLFAPLTDEQGLFRNDPPRWAKRLAAVLPYIDPSMGGIATEWAVKDADLTHICVECFPVAGKG